MDLVTELLLSTSVPESIVLYQSILDYEIIEVL